MPGSPGADDGAIEKLDGPAWSTAYRVVGDGRVKG